MRIDLKTIKEWDGLKNWLEKAFKEDYMKVLENCGQRGVEALEKATPKRTGLTSRSWRYVIERKGNDVVLYWTNDNKTSDGDLIVILLQYGHGTGRGGYVKGRDFINPAMKPVFDSIDEDIRKVMAEK